MRAYWIFRLGIFPILPFLFFEAAQIKRTGIRLPSLSENKKFGNGKSKLLLIGESTAAGVGASSIEKTLGGNLSSLFGKDYELVNLGKNGLTARQAYSFLKKNQGDKPLKINGLILFLGANDCFRLTRPGHFKDSLQQLITSASTDYQPDWIYLADIPPVHLFPAFSILMKKFLKIQRSYLQQEMVELATNNRKIIFAPIYLDLQPDFFSKDKIHPSDKGYQKIAEFAWETLQLKGCMPS